MIKEIKLNESTIKYHMQYKDVKNINLRIKPDGTICVSANPRIPQRAVEDFIRSKEKLILKSLKSFGERAQKPQIRYFSDYELKDVVHSICQRLYPHFEARGVAYPVVKFRTMVSQWGNCHSKKGVVTFNTHLAYAPPECIEYVVAHELTHFLQPNHSALFYSELAKVIPDWKELRQKLKEISIREVPV